MSPKAARAGLYTLLGGGAVLVLLPLLWMVSASLMPPGQAEGYPPRLLPSRPTFEHYATLFTRLDFGRSLLNSLFVALAVTTLSLIVNSMAGYALAKLRFRGRSGVVSLLSAALVLPAQASMLPLFLLFKELGLVNTYWGVIIPSLAGIFSILLIRQYALSVPDDLLDAARVDGAGELRIYWSIVLPAVRPALAVTAAWTFIGTWNDFMWPLVVLSDAAKYTLPVGLAALAGEHAEDTELMMAGAVLTGLPVMLAFFAFQRYCLDAIATEGAKGGVPWQV